MAEIFVNLKRFDVPRTVGGICPVGAPREWIASVLEDCVRMGLGKLDGATLTFLLPEGLIGAAAAKLSEYTEAEIETLEIGAQGVFREDVRPGGNFGAFTSNLPAAAARNLGCTWTMIAHSEERKDKLGLLAAFEPGVATETGLRMRAGDTVNRIINAEVHCALDAGLNVLLCVGETAEERGDGPFAAQRPRIEAVLKSQLELNLDGVAEKLAGRKIVIGYEPIWAIGPGKTPPDADYIGFVSGFIKETFRALSGPDVPVVYGGGLKEENAEMIAGVETIDGGLIALTKFTQPIAFETEGLKAIIEKYLG